MKNAVDELATEVISPNEADIIDKLMQMNVKTQTSQNGIAKRAQHGKHHGCVKATITVLAISDEHQDLRIGVFKEPKVYDALIRFSNGLKSDDRVPDAHGMAIKLLDVPGEKLLPGHENETSHDFILVDNPVFFTKDLDDYVIFNKHFTKVLALLRGWKSLIWGGPRIIAGIYGGLSLKIFHKKLEERATEFSSQTPNSPLSTDYWSTTPYLFGEGVAVKYMAKCKQSELKKVTDANGLSIALKRTLKQNSVSFDFGVHQQTDALKQPIEDATINWDEHDRNFIHLASIEIPAQDLDAANSQELLAEHLVFSPWHALVCHRPLGIVNRARREVYIRMSKLRHEANHVNPSGTSELPNV